MSKILEDIKSIKILAERVHAHLIKNKINKAINEVKQIIDLDQDELARLQREHGDQRLLQESTRVLNAAKKALHDLESIESFDEAKELIDRIIAIEEHEIRGHPL